MDTQSTVFRDCSNIPTPTSSLASIKPKGSATIIIFYGVSSMGKTTFSNLLHQKAKSAKMNYFRASFDQAGEKIISTYKAEHPEETNAEDIFISCWSSITANFHSNIIDTVQNQLTPGSNLFIVDDAKIDPSVLAKLSSSALRPDFEINLIAVYPETENWQITEDLLVPFSFQFIANLCMRVLARGEHGTMNYGGAKKLQIVLSFCLLYKGVEDIKTYFQKEAKFESMVAVPFHQEVTGGEEEEEAVLELKGMVVDAILKIKGLFESPMVNGVEEFEKIVNFFEDKEKVEKIGGILSYGGDEDWERLATKLVGGHKENELLE